MTKLPPLAPRLEHLRPLPSASDDPAQSESIRGITFWSVVASLALLAAKPLLDIIGEDPGANAIDFGTILTMIGGAFMVTALLTGLLNTERLPWSLFLIFAAIVIMLLLSVVSYLAISSRDELLELFKRHRTVVFGPFVPPATGVAREALRLIVSFAPLALIGVMMRYGKAIADHLLRYTVLAVVGAALIHCLIAWLQVLGIVEYTFYFIMPDVYMGRPSGGYHHPMSLGRLLIFCVFMLYMGYDRLRLGPVKHYALIAVLFGTTVISTHRLSIICVTMVIALFEGRRLLALRGQRRLNRKTVIRSVAGAVALALVTVVIMGNHLASRIKVMFAAVGSWDVGSDRFLNGRGAVWIDTVRAFGKSSWDIWLFGFGYEPWDMHNDLARIAVVWGATGVILTVAMLVILYGFTRNLVSARGRWALMILYLVLLGFGLTQKPTSYPYFMWLFLFCHMLILGYYPIFRRAGDWQTRAPAMTTAAPDLDAPRERTDWSEAEASVLSPVNPDLALPFFSVCIVVRDRPELLKKAVVSVLENSFRDFELVIIDDGSAIPVTEVLAPHPYSADPRIRVFRQDRYGISPARNHALKMAKGVFITVLDSDDELASNALRLLHDFLVTTSSLWVYTDYQEMGEEVCRLIRLPEYGSPQSMLRGILTRPRLPFKHSGMTIQRDLLLGMGGYDESLRLFEDIDLMLRGLRAGIHPRHLAEPIVQYRWHDGNITRQRRLHGISVWFQLIDLHRPTRVPGGNARMKMVRAAGELGKWLVRLVG